MPSTNRFESVTEAPDDAVTVRLMLIDGETRGEALWRPVAAGGRIEGPFLGDPEAPPVAFSKAIDAMNRYGLKRIVVLLEEGAVWNPDWGTLFRD